MVKTDSPRPGSVNRDPFETLQSSREPRGSQHQDGIPAVAFSNIVSTASASLPELCKPSVRVAMRGPYLLRALVRSGTMAKVASVELLRPALLVVTREPLKFEWLRFLKVLHGVP
jgi:hypothetical protein